MNGSDSGIRRRVATSSSSLTHSPLVNTMRLNRSLQPTLSFIRTTAVKQASTHSESTLLSSTSRCSCSTFSTLSSTSSSSIPPSSNKSSTSFNKIAASRSRQTTILSQRNSNYSPNQLDIRSFSTSSASRNQSSSSTNSTRDAQARFAKAQSEAYKNKNRSLFMYTAAVVSIQE